LNCTARIGWLNRMTQFKEKSGKNREGASVGLYAYPVLQAADVLLYQATHVPVGEDQKQHIELIRDIAAKFNTDYRREVFALPEPLIGEDGARSCRCATGPPRCRSRTPSDMSRVNLTDDADTVAQKIRKAKTDPEPLPESMEALAGGPEAKNLVTVYAVLADEAPAAVLARFAGRASAPSSRPRRAARRNDASDQGAAGRAAPRSPPSSTASSSAAHSALRRRPNRRSTPPMKRSD
jgi:tryptophanyl-tRNA synthetase